LWAVPFGLIGGRLYHVMTDWMVYFGPDGRGFIAALKIWDGGLGIWGAVALGGVGAWIGCRQRGIPLPAFGDAIAPGIVLAQAIGRIGNYFNQELYGRPTAMPWGMKVYERQDASGVLDVHSVDGISTGQVHAIVQPTFLYELIWNVLVFVALIYLDRLFKMGHGRLFATYVAAYCVGRFWVELLRDDSATHIAGIRINSFTSTFVFVGAIVYIMLAPKGREDPAALAGKPREPEEAEAKAGEPKEPVKAEDSTLMEWTKELAAVAAPSGVVAGVAVAAEHDEDESEPQDSSVEETPVESEHSEEAVAEAEAEQSETADTADDGAEPDAEAEESGEAEPSDEEPTAEAEPAEPEEAEPAAEEGGESEADTEAEAEAEPEESVEAIATTEAEEAAPAEPEEAEPAVEEGGESEPEADTEAEEAEPEESAEPIAAEPETAEITEHSGEEAEPVESGPKDRRRRFRLPGFARRQR
jgi:prolipoprotein diacylglyceryl transferase